MELTPIAAWLNSVFAGFDTAIAQFAFSLHEGPLGGFFDFFFPNVTHLGDKGLFLIVVGVILLLFARTRKGGASMLIALLFGLLMTNLFLKHLVERPRPYVDEFGIFREFWQVIGHGLEKEAGSFPSGHATSVFAAMTAVFWAFDKKYSWTAFLFAGIIGFSRVYIHVHYASDILGGMLVGLLVGSAAFFLVRWLYNKIAASNSPAARLITTSDIRNLYKKREVS